MFTSSSLSSPLLDKGLPQGSVLRCLHPAASRDLNQIVSLPDGVVSSIPTRGNKIFMKFKFSFLASAIFRHETLNASRIRWKEGNGIRFPLPTLLCAGYNVKLDLETYLSSHCFFLSSFQDRYDPYVSNLILCCPHPLFPLFIRQGSYLSPPFVYFFVIVYNKGYINKNK